MMNVRFYVYATIFPFFPLPSLLRPSFPSCTITTENSTKNWQKSRTLNERKKERARENEDDFVGCCW